MIKWDNDVKLFCKPWSGGGKDCYKWANIPGRKVKDKFWESQKLEVGGQPCGDWFPWTQPGLKWQGWQSPWLEKEATGNMKTTCSQSPLFAPLLLTLTTFCKCLSRSRWTITTQNLVTSRTVAELTGARPVTFLSPVRNENTSLKVARRRVYRVWCTVGFRSFPFLFLFF